ncbi:MAG TPA: chloride channel protein, partial [Dehalococcoidia bacterium]|nr:chloride channel protein [Dehalococcoidia bacterium]
ALLVGSGGSTGPEGPAAQMVAACASWMSDLFHLSPQDRRTALAVGLGAGVGAIFKAPLAGAILGAEFLYIRDFEIEALVPGFIASVLGYTIFGAYAGWDPIFGAGTGLQFSHPEQLFWYTLLGVACGLVGIIDVRMFFAIERVFSHHLHVPRHVRPAIGGVLLGLIAIVFPQVLSTGYGWLQLAISGNTQALGLSTIIVLIFVKFACAGLTVGSGGSGGIFAPGFFIGGMVGAAMWGIFHNIAPGLPPTPAPFVIVGMGALFGGIAKAPIAVIIMVAEMTNEFSMIIPAMLAVTIAYLITQDVGIYPSQVMTRADSPAHHAEYVIPLMQTVSVADAMRTNVISVSPSDPVAEADRRMLELGIRGLPVLDKGELVGVFTATDSLKAGGSGVKTVGEGMTRELFVAHPADTVHTVLQRMTQNSISRLPVVNRDNPKQLIGMITMRDVAAALDTQMAALNDQKRPESAVNFDPFRTLPVSEAMAHEFEAFEASTPARQVVDRLVSTGGHAALVLDDDGFLIGISTLGDLNRSMNGDLTQPVLAAATRPVIVARPTQSLAEALAEPGAEQVRQIPVVEGRPGRLIPVGMLRRSDVVGAFLRARDRAATISRRVLARSGMEGDGLTTIEVTVQPEDWLAGHTLMELNLPQDAIVTSLIRHGKAMIPRGRIVLQAGDQIHITTTQSSRDLVIFQVTADRREGDIRHSEISPDGEPLPQTSATAVPPGSDVQ